MQREAEQQEHDGGRCTGPSFRVLFVLGLFAGGLFAASACSRLVGDPHPLGRTVIRDPSAWWSRTNAVLSVYSRDAGQLDEAFEKLQFARRKATALIGMASEAEPPVYCYLLDDTSVWEELSAKYAIHSNTVSLTSGSEMVCLVRGRDDLAGDAMPHELIHVLIRQAGLKLPLALEEGIALYFGWEINLEYYLSRGTVVQKKKPVPGRAAWPSVDELFQVTAYPATPETLEPFYVQSERCVRAINELIGTGAMPDFLRQVGRDGSPWREVLMNTYTCRSDQIAWIERVTVRTTE